MANANAYMNMMAQQAAAAAAAQQQQQQQQQGGMAQPGGLANPGMTDHAQRLWQQGGNPQVSVLLSPIILITVLAVERGGAGEAP